MDTTTTTEELVRTVGDIPERMGAGVCFGSPIERDGRTLIPVARVSFGYGLGFGRGVGTGHGDHGRGEGAGEGEGGGGGGGGSSSPVAVIDISRDDVEIKPVQDPTRVALAGLAFAAWAMFWITMTVRTIARERSKTRRQEIAKAG